MCNNVKTSLGGTMKKALTILLALILFVNTSYGHERDFYILEDRPNLRYIKVSFEEEEYLLFEFCNPTSPENSSCEIRQFSIENLKNIAESLRQENNLAKIRSYTDFGGGMGVILLSTRGLVYAMEKKSIVLTMSGLIVFLLASYVSFRSIDTLATMSFVDTTLTRLQGHEGTADAFVFASKHSFDILWEMHEGL